MIGRRPVLPPMRGSTDGSSKISLKWFKSKGLQLPRERTISSLSNQRILTENDIVKKSVGAREIGKILIIDNIFTNLYIYSRGFLILR